MPNEAADLKDKDIRSGTLHLGVTATPERTDKTKLTDIFDVTVSVGLCACASGSRDVADSKQKVTLPHIDNSAPS